MILFPISNYSYQILAKKLKLINITILLKKLLQELQKGNIDFAFVSDYQLRDINENSLLVYKETIILVLPASHRCSKLERVDLNDVTDLPIFWFKQYQNPVFYEQCERVFKTLTSPIVRRAELADNLSMLLDVSLGKEMMLLSQSMTMNHDYLICYVHWY